MSSGRPMKKILVLPYFASDSAGPDFGEVSNPKSFSASRIWRAHPSRGRDAAALCGGKIIESNPGISRTNRTSKITDRRFGDRRIARHCDLVVSGVPHVFEATRIALSDSNLLRS